MQINLGRHHLLITQRSNDAASANELVNVALGAGE
jgi:hypothetical protein